MYTHPHTHTLHSDRLCIVVCGNKEGERLQMTHNADVITMFLIDCIPSITMQSICITAGAIKLQCDVCLREDFTLVIKPYASINMKCCQCVSSLPFSASLYVCVYIVGHSFVGLIIYFTILLSVHCTPGTHLHVDSVHLSIKNGGAPRPTPHRGGKTGTFM